MVTCFLRYVLDPYKLKEFEHYGKLWISLVEKFGGKHHGYFLPSEGANNIGLAMFTFPSLSEYEHYRQQSLKDPDCLSAFKYAEDTRCIISYERTFFRPVLQGHGSGPMNDHELLRAFEECSLPRDRWTHRCHVKIAYLYLRRFPYEQALTKIRSGIQKYNAAKSVADGPTSGYNETTTVAFARLIAATIDAYEAVTPTSTADEFCDAHPQLMTSHVLRLFYSPAIGSNTVAKTQFVEPDLATLPFHCNAVACKTDGLPELDGG